MRLDRIARNALRRILPGAVAALSVGVVGCSPKVAVMLTATGNLNNCGKTEARQLSYRIIQVTDAGPLAGMKVERIFGHEEAMLGGGLLWRGPESVIEPGMHKKDKGIRLDPRARAVVVIGNFCQTKGSCFYHAQTVTGKKGVKIALTADATCLTPSNP